MGAPWEIFSLVGVTMFFGIMFCYYMSQKQKEYFAEQAAAASTPILVTLPMSSHPTSDTLLPVYSVAVLTPAVTLIPSAPPPPAAAASSSSSSSLPFSSTVPAGEGGLSGTMGGAQHPGVDSLWSPPPSYQPIAIPR